MKNKLCTFLAILFACMCVSVVQAQAGPGSLLKDKIDEATGYYTSGGENADLLKAAIDRAQTALDHSSALEQQVIILNNAILAFRVDNTTLTKPEAAPLKPVVSGDYVIYHTASNKYLSNDAAGALSALNDYGYIKNENAYLWTVTVSGEQITLKQASSSKFMTASSVNDYSILLRDADGDNSKWILKDVQDGYNLASTRATGKLVGVDKVSGNDLGIYYNKDASKKPLFQFIPKDVFLGLASRLEVFQTKVELRAELDKSNKLVAAHPESSTLDATAAYEAVIARAREVYLDENATLKEVQDALLSIPVAFRAYAFSENVASEENPIDISFLIQNPDFNSGDALGWTGAIGKPDKEVYEMYQKSYNMYQEITGLPKGYYQLRVQGFARPKGNDKGEAYKAGTEVINTCLYAKTGAGAYQQPVMSLYAEENTGSSNGYANTTTEANNAFQTGKYAANLIDGIFFEGGANSALEIGIRYDGIPCGGSWSVFDNFALFYKGYATDMAVKEIGQWVSEAEALSGAMQTTVSDVLTQVITATKDLLATQNPAQQDLDEARGNLMKAMSAAKSSVAAYEKLNRAIGDAGESTVASEEKVVTAMSVARSVYDAQTADEKGIDAALAALNRVVNTRIVMDAADGNLRELIQNPDIVQSQDKTVAPEGWENSERMNDSFTKEGISGTPVDTYLEAWAANASSVAFDYNQILTNVPNGTYELSAATFTEDKSGNAVLYANEVTVPLRNDVNGNNFFDKNNPATNTSLSVTVTDGTLRIGIKSLGELNGKWSGADYFQLTYKGGIVETVDHHVKVWGTAVENDIKNALTEQITSLDLAQALIGTPVTIVASNPNTLVYDVNEYVTVTSGISEGSTAVLNENYPFHAPEVLTATVGYTRGFNGTGICNQTNGNWQTICLPFDVTTVKAMQGNSEITLIPIQNFTGAEGASDPRPFWLYEVGADNRLTPATEMKANIPYLVAVPNDPAFYKDFYNVSGDVTFSGGEIAVTRPQSASTATYSMTANFAPVAANDADYGINAEGTYFVPNVSIPSFNAKATPVGTAKPTFLSIFGNDPDLTALPSIPTSGLQERVEVFTVESGVMIRSDRDIRISIFEVSGRLLQTPQLREGMNYITLSAGQYVINGRVMIVK